jgi:hypothetical protein
MDCRVKPGNDEHGLTHDPKPSPQGEAGTATAAPLCIMVAANSKPGRRPTGRGLPLFRHGDQAFALRLFPGRLARAADGFRLLAGLALGRFFIRLAALHLTKNALALHLLLEDSESLIDIVVANDDLQNVSNLLTALDAPSSC